MSIRGKTVILKAAWFHHDRIVGSVFFVYCTGGRSYTAGCIAVSKANMIKRIRNVTYEARICIYGR